MTSERGVAGYPRREGRGCLKSRLLFRQPVEFKIKSLDCNDLILNVAYYIKEAVQKLKFLDSPAGRDFSLPKVALKADIFRPAAEGKIHGVF